MTRIMLIAVALALCLCAYARADCPRGDFNGDCRVDLADLQIFSESWLTDPNRVADFNADTRTDLADLALFGAQWQATGCPIVINEVLAHSHSNAPDWIELYNTGVVPVHIGGWQISDDKKHPDRFRIPMGKVIPPHGYAVFYENTDFGDPLNPNAHTPFAMSENGETLYLSTGADPVFPGYLVEQPFGASATGDSFGRYLTSTGTYDFVTMSTPTVGLANAYPRVGPIVINEVMYHPLDDPDTEYVELLNISSGPVTLFDYMAMEPWRFADDSGIGLWLPSEAPVTLDKGEYLLLARDEDAVRALGVPADVRILEWRSGKLSNQGESLRLLKPGDLDEAEYRHWIEVDCIRYSDGSHPDEFPGKRDPWPTAADGLGVSLSRLFPTRYGNDPNNWQAATPTPGSAND